MTSSVRCIKELTELTGHHSTEKHQIEQQQISLLYFSDLPMDRKTMHTCSVEESCTASVVKDRKALYNIKSSFFSKIHDEVRTFMLKELQQSIEDVVSLKTTKTITTDILENVMTQVTYILSHLCDSTSSWSSTPPRSASQELASELVISTANKMREYWHLCTVSEWIGASLVSPVEIFSAVDTCLSLIVLEALSSYFETLLSICSEGTSADACRIDLDTSQCDFIQAVADKIKDFSSQSTSETGTPETKEIDLSLEDLSSSEEHPGEIILETIFISCLSNICSDKAKIKDCEPFERFWKTLQADASELISDVIFKETTEFVESCSPLSFSPEACAKIKYCTQSASLELVAQLTCELATALSEEIADPSVDPDLYESQVKLVSKQLQTIARTILKKALQTSFTARSEQSFSVDELAYLTSTLLSGSKQVVKSILRRYEKCLSRKLAKDVQRSDEAKEFLESLREHLEYMNIRTLKDTAGLDKEIFCGPISADPEFFRMFVFESLYSADQIPKKKKTFFKIRMPKIFKRSRKVEPVLDPSSAFIEERCVSPGMSLAPIQEELSRPLDDSTDSSPPKKKKCIWSRITRAFSSVFGKQRKPLDG
ncbi:uncharacterized protein LOC111195823 isoform X5 [Astyanax mexicanus]|uniref:uncharacterized protein LOC111195823 isoform X5 n=1 Tax=Astyanax mexicanus TaxID=7994 RepID=UPI0020CAFD51|nr:uncharacterized protein LOC111195823 isoform X5 [Astyanax mexicanus]